MTTKNIGEMSEKFEINPSKDHHKNSTLDLLSLKFVSVVINEFVAGGQRQIF